MDGFTSEVEEVKKGKVGMVPWPIAIALAIPKTLFLLFVVFGGITAIFSMQYFDLSDPLAGIRIRDDVIAEQADGWYLAIQNASSFWSTDSGESSKDVKQVERTRSTMCNELLYVARDGNMYTPEKLARVKKIEDDIVNLPGYKNFCRINGDTGECSKIKSILNYLTDITNQTAINEDIADVWANKRSSVLSFFTKEFDGNQTMTSFASRSYYCHGLPLAGYLNREDREDEQEKKIEEFLYQGYNGGMSMEKLLKGHLADHSNNMDFNYGQWALIRKETNDILGQDILKCVFAVIFILIVMIIHMRSFFLAFSALLQVLLSFPCAFFLYRLAFGIELFGGLQSLAIFVVLGVGADDCFIYLDAFRQALTFPASEGWDLEKRLSFAYKRARFTMMVTTMTTSFAFLLLTVSRVPGVRYLGLFAALLMVMNFALVLSLFSVVLVVWAKYIRPIKVNKELFARFGFSSSADGATKNKVADREGDDEIVGSTVSSRSASSQEGELSVEIKSLSTPPKEEYEVVDTRYGRLVTGRKTSGIILIVFAVLCVVMLSFAVQLGIASEESYFWAKDHHIAIFRALVPEAFHDASQEANKIFHVVHGLEDPFVDRTGTSETVADDFGVPIYSSIFDLSDPEAQAHLVFECREAFATSHNLFLSGPGNEAAYCFMVVFELYKLARNEVFPMADPGPVPAPVIPGLTTSTAEAARYSKSFEFELYEFLNRPQFSAFKTQVGMTHKEEDFRLRANFVFQSFATALDGEDSYQRRTDADESWELFLEDITKNQPKSLGAAEDTFYTEFDYFVFMKTQFLFIANSFSSLGLSTLLTLGFLIWATNNYKVALLAAITITGIIVTVLGFIVLIGWSLDTITSVSITLLVGFAVDYVVHCAVSYDEASREGIPDRVDKTKYVASTMFGSVAAGAASTFGAACMLFPTTIMFFKQFGGFLSMAIAVSLIYALVFFPALLSRYGPNKLDGQMFVCLEKSDRSGIYKASNHQPRSERSTRRFIWFTISMFIAAIFAVLLIYSARTDSLFFKDSDPPAPAPIQIWPELNFSATEITTDLDPGLWYKLSPGGESTCARGEPFSFFFRRSTITEPSTKTKLIVEFEGGNYCWNYITCRVESQWIRDNIDVAESRFVDKATGEMKPKFGISDSRGPYDNTHHLFIPLCTGDFHWGNNTMEYSAEVSVEHKGAINVFSTLQFVLNQLEDLNVDSIMVTGANTGAYAGILYSTIIAAWLELTAQNQDINLVVHGDSGLGLMAPDFLEDAFEAWGVNLTESFALFGLNATDFLEVPITQLSPEGFQDIFNTSFTYNLTAVNECLEAESNGTVTITELANQILFPNINNGGGNLLNETNPIVEKCLNDTDNILFDFNSGNSTLVNGGGGGSNSTNGTGVGIGNGGGVNGPVTIPWDQWQNEFNCTFEPNLPTSCFNTTGNFSGFDPSDFVFNVTNNIQIIPSLYLLNAYRFGQWHTYSQASSAYDYRQTMQAASQLVGYPIPGVRFSEQKLWHDLVTTLYDRFLPLMPTNGAYHHWFIEGDWSDHINNDRHYSVLSHELYQILYGFTMKLNTTSYGLTANYDCRDLDVCENGVDTRETVLYF